MMTKRKKTYTGDALVPISPPFLRALIKDRKLTVGELARRIGDSDQAIRYLATGDASSGKRCRLSRLRRIAKELRVQDGLLQLGGFVDPPVWHRAGFGFHYSARIWLAVDRLLTSVHDAWQRDVKGEKATGIVDEVSEAERWRAVERGIHELINAGAWREMLLLNRRDRHPRHGRVEPSMRDPQAQWPEPADDPEYEESVIRLIAVFEYLLEPWFADKRPSITRDFYTLP
jgi:DNA-binding Xre family transcriptional regulator